MRTPVLALCAVLALGLAAACSDDSTPVDLTPVADPVIDQDRLSFRPNAVTIFAGTTVRFTNSETALHTVNIDGVNESGEMRRDDVFEYTFEEAGTYRITCQYHPQMRATITVVEE